MPPASSLLASATAAAAKAYAPYSRFQVGCALLTAQGNLFTGCNVENASYGLTICAERNTIFRAVAEEGPGMKIAELAVIALGHEFPPCGACRQWLDAHGKASVPVEPEDRLWDGVAVTDVARSFRLTNTLTSRFEKCRADARKAALQRLFGEQP
ncbi:MAG TPA: cytidine deaminase [Candidatus Hydrogenedentes bacterium]|nr:cytidine deaminase [Candidatus Hydrogenedentota bacterium]